MGYGKDHPILMLVDMMLFRFATESFISTSTTLPPCKSYLQLDISPRAIFESALRTDCRLTMMKSFNEFSRRANASSDLDYHQIFRHLRRETCRRVKPLSQFRSCGLHGHRPVIAVFLDG
ncbi:hypothetical protein BDV11DRAFT_187484, partial [Aspergillus similis]